MKFKHEFKHETVNATETKLSNREILQLVNAFINGDFEYDVAGWSVVEVSDIKHSEVFNTLYKIEVLNELDSVSDELKKAYDEYLLIQLYEQGDITLEELEDDYNVYSNIFIDARYELDIMPLTVLSQLKVSSYITEQESVLKGLIEANNKMILKAPTGAGKSTFVLGLAKLMNRRVIIVVPNIPIGENLNASEFNTKLIHAKSKDIINEDDKTIIVVQGNEDKIKPLRNDILVIDEAQELYEASYKMRSTNKLLTYMKSFNSVVLLSGSWRGSLHNDLHDFKIVEVIKDKPKKTIRFVKTKDRKAYTFNKIKNTKGLKAVYINDKNEGEAWKMKLEGIDTILINSDTKYDDVVSNTLKTGVVNNELILATSILNTGWSCINDSAKTVIWYDNMKYSSGIEQFINRFRKGDVDVIIPITDIKNFKGEFNRFDYEQELINELTETQTELNDLLNSDYSDDVKTIIKNGLRVNSEVDEKYLGLMLVNDKVELNYTYIANKAFEKEKQYENNNFNVLVRRLIGYGYDVILEHDDTSYDNVDTSEEKTIIKEKRKEEVNEFIDGIEENDLDSDDNIIKAVSYLNSFTDFDNAKELAKEHIHSKRKMNTCIKRLELQKIIESDKQTRTIKMMCKYLELNKRYTSNDLLNIFQKHFNNSKEFKDTKFTKNKVINIINLFYNTSKFKVNGNYQYELNKLGYYDFKILDKKQVNDDWLEKLFK